MLVLASCAASAADPDLFKEAAQGRFQVNVHGRVTPPNGLVLISLHSKEPPDANDSRFRCDAYDRALEQYMRASNEPERLAAARIMNDVDSAKQRLAGGR